MNAQQQTILQMANIITTGLSIVGELFMIFSYMKLRDYQTYAMRLVNALAISDLIYSLANLLSVFPQTNPYICVPEGFLRQIGATSAAFWVVVIAYTTYKQATNFDKTRERNFGKIQMVIYTLGLILAGIPLGGNLSGGYPGYGGQFSWCSISNEYMLLGLFYSIIMIGALISLVLYCRLYWNVKTSADQFNIKYFFLYPFILFISWTPAIADLVYTDFMGNNTFYLRLIHVIGSHTQGFVNAIAYGFAQRVQMLKSSPERALLRKKTNSEIRTGNSGSVIVENYTMSIINKREELAITESLRTALEDIY